MQHKLLYAKQFIISKKFSDGDVDFDGFKKYLCKMFEIEKRVAIWNDKKDAFRGLEALYIRLSSTRTVNHDE